MTEKKALIFLLIIIAIASFFRLWQLSSIPPGLYPDVAINGNDAIASLKSGDFKVFYPDNNGREGLFIWLIALSFSIFGVSIWSIKIVAAIIGILTVPGLYLLTKELFNKNIALLSSFFLAISFWHVNFSRIGFRAILLPFILVFAFYFLFRGFRLGSTSSPQTKNILNFLISGIFFGLGFYTYISYRFIILLLPLVLICWWFIYQRQNLQRKFLLSAFYFLFSIFIVALPIGIYFLQNPQDFLLRTAPISIFSAENPIKEFGKSLIFHLGMFNFYGDPNWRHNYAGSPMLPWPLGILFLIGIIFSIKGSIKSLKLKNWSSGINHLSLVSWFFIMLLPGILTYEGIPHALRTIGVIPVISIFAGFGGWKIYEFFSRNASRKILLFTASFLFILTIGIFEFNKYFVCWAKNPNLKEAFTKQYAEIGYFLNSLPENVQKYVIVNELGFPLYGISIPAQTPMFIERAKFGEVRSTYLRAEDLDQIKIGQQKTLIIPLYDGRIFDELQKKFPDGKKEEGERFKFYEIE